MRFARLFIVGAMLLGLASSAFPVETLNDSEEVMRLYARGKGLLNDGRYLEAAQLFEEMAGRFPSSPNIDLIILNKAKADYNVGDFDKAIAGVSNFVTRFPSSPLRPYAVHLQANAAYRRGRLTHAVHKYVEAYGLSQANRLDEMIEASLVAAIGAARTVRLGPSDFDGAEDPKRCRLMLLAAEALARRNETDQAQRLMTACGGQFDLPSGNRPTRDHLAVGIVLPLSGELQAFGEDIYHGATIAAEMYRAESGRKIKLETFDTKGDPVDAGRIVRELSQSPYDVIVGPLTSDEAAVASATLACGDAPMIAPAATQAGLTRLSESSFQLSPNIELQGVVMAEYAANVLMADSAAIITPTGSEQLRMARAFAVRFEQLGGTLVATEYYRSRDRDFGTYIRDLKALLIGAERDSVYYINPDGDTIEPDVVPAHIECLFMPGEPGQLSQLIQQVHFYNLTAVYLGSDGWGDEAIYKLGDRITKGAVFPSPFLQQRSSEEYARFAAEYDSRYAEQPRRLAALGYDAVRLATRAAAAGTGRRADLIRELSNVSGYAGAAGLVTFGEYRENVSMPVYRLESGRPIFIGTGVVGIEGGFIPTETPERSETPDMPVSPDSTEDDQ